MPTPLIPTTYDPSRIIDYGSEMAYWRVVTDLTGAGTDTYASAPTRSLFEFMSGQSENKKVSEGRVTYTTSTSYDYTLKYATIQSGIIESFTFPDTIDGKLLEIVMELNDTAIGAEGYGYLGILAKLVKRPDVKAKSDQEYLFRIYRPTSDIVITMSNTTFPNFHATFDTDTVTIPKAKYYGAAAFL